MSVIGAGRGIAVRMAWIAAVLACGAVQAAPPLRAEAVAEENCTDRPSTADVVQCLATQTAVWDRRLSSAYQKLLTSLPARRRDRLRNAQRLWVQFRDANCAYFAARTGAIARVQAGQCLLRLTITRAMELEGES